MFLFLIPFITVVIIYFLSIRFNYNEDIDDNFWDITHASESAVSTSIRKFYFNKNKLPKNSLELISNSLEHMQLSIRKNKAIFKRKNTEIYIEQVSYYIPIDIKNICNVYNFSKPLTLVYYINNSKYKDQVYITIRFKDSNNRFLFSEKYKKLFGFDNHELF
ncbi:MAG: hypothetical protein U0457_12265 [Candidatus Sericytochromatia bacterium]